MSEPRDYVPAISAAIAENNVTELENLFQRFPEAIQFSGSLGNWVVVAARRAELHVLEYLISLGIDPNMSQKRSGRNALAVGSAEGRLDVVEWLSRRDVALDTSQSTGNPLIAAINARSVPVAEYLLDAGIDARVDYQMAPGVRYDALCFALEQGAREVANVIALHLAGGDKPGAQAELDRAWAAVKLGNPNAKTWPEAPVI